MSGWWIVVAVFALVAWDMRRSQMFGWDLMAAIVGLMAALLVLGMLL